MGKFKSSGLIFSFVIALLLSTLTSLFLPFSSVVLSYFILALPMREQHECVPHFL